MLHNIDWGTYTRLLRVFQRRRSFRLTYDRGTLEIMSPLWEHELASAHLVRFLGSLGRTGATALVAEFRDWVRQVLLVPPDREEVPPRGTSRRTTSPTKVTIGLAWYRPEQWGRLLEVSVDRDELEATHAEWKKHAEKQLKRLRRDGLVVRRVDVDVEELLQYCKKKGMTVNGEARADFAVEKLQRSEGRP